MNIRTSKEKGSAILICVVTCMVIGIALASNLQLASFQNRSVQRSQTWNSAIPAAEAGVEEALAHINDSVIGTNFALNGWVVSSNRYVMSRTVGDSRYYSTVSTDRYPVIISTGYVFDSSAQREISRTVRVGTTQFATGMKGMVAKSDIVMSSGASIDSFDSEDARFSTRGHYDPAKNKDGGYAGSVNGNISGGTIFGSAGTGPTGSANSDVGDFAWLASHTGIEPGHYANDLNIAFPEVQAPFSGGAFTPVGGNVTLTNLDYWSTVITTADYPVSPASAVTTNTFGSTTVTNYPTGITASLITTNTTAQRTKTLPAAGTYLHLTQQGAWNYYDLITSYTYPVQTYTYSLTAPNSSVTTEYYDFILSGGNYQVSSMSLSGSQRLLVTRDSVLYDTGDFSMTGNSKLIIVPGASLKLYVAGNTSLAGNGVFNYTLDASKFMYYGLPSNTKIDISGNAAFTGVIYAPRADLKLNGSGNSVYDVVGATVTKTATFNGHFHFHYDERLGRSQVLSKFTVAYWQEWTEI